MARVRITVEEDLSWESGTASASELEISKLGEGERSSMVRVREMGSDTSPQLVELRYVPNATINVHAHGEDEIIYVLTGEMRLGTRSLGSGATLFVAANTLYGFQAGPDGLHILNFRPRKDLTFITPKEFSKRQRRIRTASTQL